MIDPTASGIRFRIYPLGVADTPAGLAAGPPDDYPQIHSALDDLGGQVVARTYLVDMNQAGKTRSWLSRGGSDSRAEGA